MANNFSRLVSLKPFGSKAPKNLVFRSGCLYPLLVFLFIYAL